MFWQNWVWQGWCAIFHPDVGVQLSNNKLTNSIPSHIFSWSKMPLVGLSIRPITLYMKGISTVIWHSGGEKCKTYLHRNWNLISKNKGVWGRNKKKYGEKGSEMWGFQVILVCRDIVNYCREGWCHQGAEGDRNIKENKRR